MSTTYRNEDLPIFQNHPCIEALPEPFEPNQAIRKLMIRPEYSEEDRKRSVAKRRLLTQNLARLHQPLSREVDIFSAIDRCIRWGYVDRNPLTPEFIAQLSSCYKAAARGLTLRNLHEYHPHTYGFSILGISGIGKSTTVETILSFYPQVIRHTNYRGIPLSLTQITWVKLDCTPDGSLKGLCLAFFQKLDELTGCTSYYQQYQNRCTLDNMILKMAHLVKVFHVGLIVLDELQNLCTATKDIPAKVLNFFVTLVNTIGVPVVMIGTPKALSILQSEFQQAKRGSGQGDALWERMKNDQEWDMFCRSIWEYQYTQTNVPFTPEMRNALYAEAQGIPFLAVHIYKLVQEDAILSGREKFTPKDFRRVATEKMGLTKPMRDALRIGKDVDLQQFLDIAPFSLKDYSDNYSVAAETKNPVKVPPVKPNIQEAAIVTMLGMGLSYSDANSCVSWAIAKLANCTVPSHIAQTAYEYFNSRNRKLPEKAPLDNLSGYDALLQAGFIDAGRIQEACYE